MEATTGIDLIIEERQKQFIKGRTIANDVANNNKSELISAIMLLSASIGFKRGGAAFPKEAFDDLRPETWNEEKCIEYIDKPELDQLKMIGAFAAAEIDRLQNS